MFNFEELAPEDQTEIESRLQAEAENSIISPLPFDHGDFAKERIWNEILQGRALEKQAREKAKWQSGSDDGANPGRFAPPPHVSQGMAFVKRVAEKQSKKDAHPQRSGSDGSFEAGMDYSIGKLAQSIWSLWEWNVAQAKQLAAAHDSLRALIDQQTPRFRLAERDKWVYEQYQRGTHWKNIVAILKDMADEKGWPVFEKRKGVYDAVRRHQKNNPNASKVLD